MQSRGTLGDSIVADKAWLGVKSMDILITNSEPLTEV